MVLHAFEQTPKSRDHTLMLHLVIGAQARLNANLSGPGGVARPKAIILGHPLGKILIGLQKELSAGQIRVFLLLEIADEKGLIGMVAEGLKVVDIGVHQRKFNQVFKTLLIIRAPLQMLGDTHRNLAPASADSDK